MELDFSNIADLNAEQLAELRTKAREALAQLLEVEHPTAAQAQEAQALAQNIRNVDTELTARNEAEQTLSALRTEFSTDNQGDAPIAENPSGGATPQEQEEAAKRAVPGGYGMAAEGETVVEKNADESASSTSSAQETVTAQVNVTVQPTVTAAPDLSAVAGARPAAVGTGVRPASQYGRGNVLTMRAAADVPGYSTGTELRDADQLAEAMLAKMKNFVEPNGDGSTQDLRYFGLASLNLNIPEEFVLPPNCSPEQFDEVVGRAVDQTRLPGGNLVASNGWCAPSEVRYDLTEGETTDGMLSIPEVGLNRGGIKWTLGPDWSDIYNAAGYFAQTETQAIAGTTKPCMEVGCVTFQEARLDAVGLCIKSPILLESAYPELVKRWIRGALVAHQHKVNIRVISAIDTALGTAAASFDYNSTNNSLFSGLRFYMDRERTSRRWGMNQAMEVVLPMWVLGAMKTDLAERSARQTADVRDAEVMAQFAAANAVPHFVYGYQDLGPTATAYPNNFNVLIYKAGTFVKGTKNVIKLDSVYDAASLATNIYTALFFEEGMNVMKVGYGGLKLTVNTCNSGRLAVNDVSLCGRVTP